MRRKIKKRLVFGIVLLMAAIVFAVAMTMNISANGPEISKEVVWEKTGLNYPQDAERLESGNTLIAEMGEGRVIEVDSSGDIKWEKTGLVYPVDAERLENGNTLITEAGYYGRVIEVDYFSKEVVWEKTGLLLPQDAERLANNGHTLITDTFNRRVIEVDSSGKEVWEKTGLFFPYDAERLEKSGNTLITEAFGPSGGRVIEVKSDGTIVVVKDGLNFPYDAERLGNGNTLITENFGSFGARVIEVDYLSKEVVWEKTGLISPWDAERFVPPTFFKTFIIEKAKIDFKKKPDDDKIHVKGRFELDLDSGDGVDISEDVIVTIGLFTDTIKMEAKGKGDKWEYKRLRGENGLGIKHMKIDWKKKKKKKKNHHAEFDIRVDKANLGDMSSWTNPLTITIQIGNDLGKEEILMKEKKHHWDYHKKKHN